MKSIAIISLMAGIIVVLSVRLYMDGQRPTEGPTYADFALQGPVALQEFLNEQNTPFANKIAVDGIVGPNTMALWDRWIADEYHKQWFIEGETK